MKIPLVPEIHHLAAPMVKKLLGGAFLSVLSVAFGVYGYLNYDEESFLDEGMIGGGTLGTLVGTVIAGIAVKDLMQYTKGEYIFTPPWKGGDAPASWWR